MGRTDGAGVGQSMVPNWRTPKQRGACRRTRMMRRCFASTSLDCGAPPSKGPKVAAASLGRRSWAPPGNGGPLIGDRRGPGLFSIVETPSFSDDFDSWIVVARR